MGETRRKLTPMQKTVGKNMLQSTMNFAQTTGTSRFDADELVELKKEFKEQGKRISYTAIFTKIISLTLQDFPMFNTRLDGNEVIEYDSINVGVGIDTPKGLMIAVVKDTQDKNLFEIAEDLNDMVDRAREGKLTMEDMQGSTVTISNLIGTKTTSFSSIVNNNEAIIFGLGDIFKEPVVNEKGEIVVKNIMYISTNGNHTLINGMDSVRMGMRMREIIESPRKYLL